MWVRANRASGGGGAAVWVRANRASAGGGGGGAQCGYGQIEQVGGGGGSGDTGK